MMRTLYFRFVMATILIMLLSGLVAFVLSNHFYQFKLKPYNAQKVTQVAQNIVDFHQTHPQLPLDEHLQYVSQFGFQIYLVSQNRQEKFYGGEFKPAEMEPQAIQQVLAGKTYQGIAQFPMKAFVTGFFDNDLRNTIGVPIQLKDQAYALFIRPNVEQQFGEIRAFFAILVALIICLSIGIIVIAAHYIVKPIRILTRATKEITRGKYNIELNVQRGDEIGQLSQHFAQMASSLARLEEMRQEFVSNVSHEIQSPLASIQGFSQALQTHSLPEEQQQEYLSIIEQESRRLSLLSKQLLTLASLDKEKRTLDKSTFNLDDQLKQVLQTLEWQWQEKELAIDIHLPKTMIEAEQNLLHQVWINLIYNAIKFTPAGGTISINLSEPKPNLICVEIADTGVGIPPESLSSIFDRFYKVDKARARNLGGSGLGLAITKKIIDLHQGRIHVSSTEGEGTIFQIELPKKIYPLL